jgi:hypothetical protein
MPNFFLLSIGMFAQYKYAWYEPYGKTRYFKEYPQCPKCGRAVGGLYWQPPYNVVLKQPRKIGDFIAGAGGCDFLVSNKFLDLYTKEKLNGIEKILPITVSRMGTSKKAKSLGVPIIFGLYLRHSLTQVKHSDMGIIWFSNPEPDYCRLCGPGGGGGGGIIKSREKIVVDNKTWEGEDIFYSINLPGVILLSEKAANIILNNNLTNASIIRCEEAKDSF